MNKPELILNTEKIVTMRTIKEIAYKSVTAQIENGYNFKGGKVALKKMKVKQIISDYKFLGYTIKRA
jgi:hypothetical protein